MGKGKLTKTRFAQLENFFRLQTSFITAQILQAPKEKQEEILQALVGQRTLIEKWLLDDNEPPSIITFNPGVRPN